MGEETTMNSSLLLYRGIHLNVNTSSVTQCNLHLVACGAF